MSKYAVCDNCGAKDDWTVDKVPILDGGAVIQLRADNGGDEFEHTLEICEGCREKLLEAFPALQKAMAK